MAKKERVPREAQPVKDVFKPLVSMGTKDDPCFGKLYDPKDNTCSRCGDSEHCTIAMGQQNHLKRAKAEAKNSYKDLEPAPDTPLMDIKKLARKRLIELIKKSPNKEMGYITKEVYSIYFAHGITKVMIKRMITRLADKNLISINSKNNNIKWN